MLRNINCGIDFYLDLQKKYAFFQEQTRNGKNLHEINIGQFQPSKLVNITSAISEQQKDTFLTDVAFPYLQRGTTGQPRPTGQRRQRGSQNNFETCNLRPKKCQKTRIKSQKQN